TPVHRTAEPRDLKAAYGNSLRRPGARSLPGVVADALHPHPSPILRRALRPQVGQVAVVIFRCPVCPVDNELNEVRYPYWCSKSRENGGKRAGRNALPAPAMAMEIPDTLCRFCRPATVLPDGRHVIVR